MEVNDFLVLMVSNNAIYSKKYAPCPRPFSKYEWEWNLVSCPNLAHFLHFPSWIFSTKRTLFNNVVHALSTQQWLLGDTKGCIDLIESDNRNKMPYSMPYVSDEYILSERAESWRHASLCMSVFYRPTLPSFFPLLSSQGLDLTDGGGRPPREISSFGSYILQMNWFQSAATSSDTLFCE